MKEHKYKIDANAQGVVQEQESIRELAMESVHDGLVSVGYHLHQWLDLDRQKQVEKASFVQHLRASLAHLRLLTDAERTAAIERATKHVAPENRETFTRMLTVEGFIDAVAMDVQDLLK